MPGRQQIRIGDVYELSLPNGKLAYAQHVSRNQSLGYLVRVFSQILDLPLGDLADLQINSLLFPPVFIGLRATVSSGRWKRIGNSPVKNFTFPKFRQTMATKQGTYSDWLIWDGVRTIRLGKLPEKYRSLELRCVWGDIGLEERIVAGTYRGDLMF